MISYRKHTIQSFFTYPFTWLCLTLILVFHLLFQFWFNPSLPILLVLISGDFLLVSLWIILAFHSKAFKNYCMKKPEMERYNELNSIFKDCPDNFKNPAEECVELIRKMKDEFSDMHYDYEMDEMLLNIKILAENHRELYLRYLKFGTRKQKTEMKALLDSQVSSIQNTLTTLKSFSGNLSLLDAETSGGLNPISELKYTNEDLKKAIEELDNV
jgi:hypothetical protein